MIGIARHRDPSRKYYIRFYRDAIRLVLGHQRFWIFW